MIAFLIRLLYFMCGRNEQGEFVAYPGNPEYMWIALFVKLIMLGVLIVWVIALIAWLSTYFIH